MVGVENITFALVLTSAGHHARRLLLLHLRPQTRMALICINDACYELHRWLPLTTRLVSPPEGEKRSGPLVTSAKTCFNKGRWSKDRGMSLSKDNSVTRLI